MGTLKMNEAKENERVRVVVRCRPMNTKEAKSGFCKVIDVLPAIGAIKIFNPKENDMEGKTFTFDAVYDSDSTQEDLYEESVQPVVNAVLAGFNGTIFAYGQTGTGKTFTMEGDQLNPLKRGVIPKTFDQIFNHILQSKNTQYLVRASYIEIYQEEVKDLLDGSGKKCYEVRGNGSGVFIKNLKSRVCKSAKEMEAVMNHGNRNRKIGTTDMNDHSSRSHAIFVVTVETSKTISGINQVRVGKLNLVDLAGSERQSKSCASGERLKEASKINLSLSALGNVISALSSGKNFHIPYRDSKLTRLLQDSLGGNSKTLMIANIGPASYNYDESLTTLRYANRAKNIKNKPRINEDPKDALIREYQNEIKRLKTLVQAKITANNKIKTEPAVHINRSDSNRVTDDEVANQMLKDYQMSVEVTSLCDDDKAKRINDEVQKKKYFLTAERQYIEELKDKINLMESKLLFGKNIVEHTNEQQEVLKRQEAEIKERKRHKTELKLQLQQEEETTEELQETRMNLQQEIKRKSKKLDKMYKKLEEVKQQTADLIEGFNSDRRDLELAQNDLIKEYKLNHLIIDNFIPVSERQKFTSRLCYDTENDKWIKNELFLTDKIKASPTIRKPQTNNTRIQTKLECSPRYKTENIINLTTECLGQTTISYTSPEVSPSVKCAMEKALKAEDDITVNAMPLKMSSLIKINQKNILKQTISDECQNNILIYPKVRGLVKK